MVFDIHDWLIVIDYLQSSQSQFCHFSKHFFVIVVNLFYFTENFASVHLVDFVGQFVGSNVGLQSQLKLSNDILVYDNFERYVWDGNRIVESALNFDDSVFLRVFGDELLYLSNCIDDILHSCIGALPPNHVRYPKMDLGFLLE